MGQDIKSEAASVAADWGTMVHHWAETGEIHSPRENLPPLFRKKLEQSGVRREQWWPEGMTHETALAVNPLREYRQKADGDRGAKEEWKAAFGDDWCTGTGDGHMQMFDVLWLDDLKTGKNVTFQEYEQQLKFYALGLSRVLEYRGPVHATLTWWPRYPVVSQPSRFGRVIEQDELAVFEKQLVQLRDTILWARAGEIDIRDYLKPGEAQCLWCPARQGCPEYGTSEERN